MTPTIIGGGTGSMLVMVTTTSIIGIGITGIVRTMMTPISAGAPVSPVDRHG
jgi:hypothetical protein